jgi:hypothetical protein
MSESNHSDLADALSRLASGDVAPSEREHEPPVPPPAPPTPRVAKVTFRPITPVAPTVARPASPARPVIPSIATPHPAARPQRPAVPTVRPLAPPSPAGPTLTEPALPVDDPAVVDDDDAVIVPAPDASVFIPRKKPATSAEARARVARKKQLEFRQTLIPILLTTGVLAIAFGVAPFALGPDSIAAHLPRWVTPTLIAIGAVQLALAGANMASVRSMLLADSQPSGSN